MSDAIRWHLTAFEMHRIFGEPLPNCPVNAITRFVLASDYDKLAAELKGFKEERAYYLADNARLAAELASHERMAAAGVYSTNEEFMHDVAVRDALRAQVEGLAEVLSLLVAQVDAFHNGECVAAVLYQVCDESRAALAAGPEQRAEQYACPNCAGAGCTDCMPDQPSERRYYCDRCGGQWHGGLSCTTYTRDGATDPTTGSPNE